MVQDGSEMIQDGSKITQTGSRLAEDRGTFSYKIVMQVNKHAVGEPRRVMEALRPCRRCWGDLEAKKVPQDGPIWTADATGRSKNASNKLQNGSNVTKTRGRGVVERGDTPRSPKLGGQGGGTRRTKMARRCPRLVQKWFEEGPKWFQDHPNWSQMGRRQPKIAQDRPRWP